MVSEPHALKFRECSGDKKYLNLTEGDFDSPDNDNNYRILTTHAARNGIDLAQARVLDFGCGRGQLVGYLRLRGVHAYGIEVDSKLVQAGAVLGNLYHDERPLLSLVDPNGRTPFPDGYFDVILANQVFEHVAHLDEVSGEIARLLRPGGMLVTLYPARFTLIEPHYHLCIVHWLPKGKLQRSLIHFLVRAGFGVPPPSGISRTQMGDIVSEYAEQDVFYRSNRVIGEMHARNGIRLDFQQVPRDMLERKLSRMSGLRRRAYSTLAATLPLVPIRNLFKSCAAVGVKQGNVN